MSPQDSEALALMLQGVEKAVYDGMRRALAEERSAKAFAMGSMRGESDPLMGTGMYANRPQWTVKEKTDEVDGEREVWAQAYAALFMQTWDSDTVGADNSLTARGERAAALCNEAVKHFRERYK